MSRYVVLDLEMCKVTKAQRRGVFQSARELIQIGAVELDENYQVARTFMSYVKPEFGAIDSTIQRLTGITSQDVENAPLAKDALKAFSEWLPEDAVLVTWSDSDVAQIDDELYFKDIDLPKLYNCLDEYIDSQVLFSKKMRREKSYNLKEALSLANIFYDVNIHDALVDARNTALLFSKLETEEVLVLSPYYMSQEDLVTYHRRFAYC